MPQYPYNQDVGYKYAHIAAAATTVVKAAAGQLVSLCINTASTGIITIYDNTAASGTVVGIITIGTAVTVPFEWALTQYANIKMTTGITIVTSAACDITVLYN